MQCCKKNWYRIRASACDTAGYGMVFYEIGICDAAESACAAVCWNCTGVRNCRGSAGVCGDAAGSTRAYRIAACHVILSGYEKILYDCIGSASCVADYRKTIRSKNYRILSAACRGTFFSHVTKRQKEMQQMTEENGRQKRRKELPGNGVGLFACGLGLLVFVYTSFKG